MPAEARLEPTKVNLPIVSVSEDSTGRGCATDHLGPVVAERDVVRACEFRPPAPLVPNLYATLQTLMKVIATTFSLEPLQPG